MNPDLAKRAIDLANAARKTARGDHGGEERARVDAVGSELAAIRPLIESDADDPQRGAAIVLLAAISDLHGSLAASTTVAEQIARVSEAASRLRVAPPSIVAAPADRALDEALDALRIRARRIPVLQRFQATIIELTRDKRFDIHNDIAWNTMFDTREMLFVDLADWSAAAHARGGGGFLRVLQTHLGLLGARMPRRDDEPAHRREQRQAERAAARARLFPGAGETTQHADFERLINAFVARFAPVMNDRNANRAHGYEHQMSRGASVALLNFEDAENVVGYATGVIKDLTFLVGNYSYDGRSFISDDIGEATREVVESILVPRDVRPSMLAAGVSTAALLDELHRDPRFRPERDIDVSRYQRAFNARSLVFRALERLGAIEPLRGTDVDEDESHDAVDVDDD